jgi:hypothetical protein
MQEIRSDVRSMQLTKSGADRQRTAQQREARRLEAAAKQQEEIVEESLDSAAYLLTPVAPRQDHHRVAAWRSTCSDIAAECHEVQSMLNPRSRRPETFGAHAVTQASVLGYLPTIDEARWCPGRPGPQNSHKRVIVAIIDQDVVAAFWTNGLSHHEERVRGNVVVYERDGGSRRFTHVPPSRKHPKDL